jgi:hypothetical protein
MPKYIAIIYSSRCASPATKRGDNLDVLTQWIKGRPGHTNSAVVVEAATAEVVYLHETAEGADGEWNLFIVHEGLKVYYAIDGPRDDPWVVEGVYSMIPDAEKDGDHTFTAADLPQYGTMPGATDEEIIRTAIDAGDLTEDD